MAQVASLLVLLIFIFVFGSIVSLVLWFAYRDQVYKKMAFFWLANLLPMVIVPAVQMLSQGSLLIEGVFLYLGSGFIMAPLLISIVDDLNGGNFPRKAFIRSSQIGAVLCALMAYATRDFTLSMFVGALFQYGPLLLTLIYIQAFRRKPQERSVVLNGFNITAILLVLHLMDYAFLRPVESFAPLGFMIHVGAAIGFIVFMLGTMVERLYKKNAEELEKKVYERTRELEEAQVRIATGSQMFAISRLAGGMAHELNSPLAATQLSAAQLGELMDGDALDRSVIKMLSSQIENSVKRMAKIILDLRKLSGFKATIESAFMPLSELVTSTIDLCAQTLKNAGINFTVSPPIKQFSALRVKCQSAQFQSVLLHLINNARDAVEGVKDPHIEIGVTEKPGFVRISVKDNGAGIDEKIRDRIFFPFFTTKDVGKGMGMGLSVSQGIVRDFGGTIGFESSSAGSCFFFEVPLE